MLNMMVVFCMWGSAWSNKKIRIHCDNTAVVSILSSGRSKDPFLSTCAQTLWLIKAIFNICVVVVPIPGHENVYADTLSQCVIRNTLITAQFNTLDPVTGITLTVLSFTQTFLLNYR